MANSLVYFHQKQKIVDKYDSVSRQDILNQQYYKITDRFFEKT